MIGGKLLHEDSCTSGFIGRKRSSGRLGVLTAGHCRDDQEWQGNPLIFDGEHQGHLGDIQFHSQGGQRYIPKFLAKKNTEIRPVLSVWDAVKDQRLCKQGRVTGYTCDNVHRVNICKRDMCGLTRMKHRRATGGDSGGPWFWGNTAYGIHQGGWGFWPEGPDDVYTPVADVIRWGVSIRCQSRSGPKDCSSL